MASRGVKIGAIIGVVIALILIGNLLPIGINDLIDYNGSYYYDNGTLQGTNTTVATLVSSVLPIMVVIAIMLPFVAIASKRN